MRLAAQAKAGFYPAAPEAVRAMLLHLELPGPAGEKSLYKDTDLCILDPCAGEGEALQILSEGLRVPPKNVYAVELHRGRAEAIRERMPEASVLGPCSFFSAEITSSRYSLVYANPPFDYSAANTGVREEHEFVRRAYELLSPKGVLILVCPFKALVGNTSFVSMIDSMYDHVEVYKFPDEHRPYNEICVFGVRRRDQLDQHNIRYLGDLSRRGLADHECAMTVDQLSALGEKQPLDWKYDYPIEEPVNWWERKKVAIRIGERETIDVWSVPHSWPPRRFAKSGLTDEEKVEFLAESPLWRDHLRETPPPSMPRPWIIPKKAHVIMLLVSGMLDGLVPVDPPHVARGYYTKKEKEDIKQCKTVENEESGAITETRVYVEEPVICIRLLEVDPISGEPKIFELRSDADEGETEEEDDSCDNE